MSTVIARHLGGDRISVNVRDHEIDVDEPIEAGGTDTGPTPVELFVASLAACVAHYARGYLHRHGLTENPIDVQARWSMGNTPARVADIELELIVPADVPAARLAGPSRRTATDGFIGTATVPGHRRTTQTTLVTDGMQRGQGFESPQRHSWLRGRGAISTLRRAGASMRQGRVPPLNRVA